MNIPSFGAFRLWGSIALVVGIGLAAWRIERAIFDRGVQSCEAAHNKSLIEHIARAQKQARDMALEDAYVSMHVVEIQKSIEIRYERTKVEVSNNVRKDASGCSSLTRYGYRMLDYALSPDRGGQTNTTDQPSDTMP